MDSVPVTAAAVVLAGGSGTRVGAGRNKVYLPLAGLRVLTWSLRAVCAVPEIGPVVVVIRAEDEDVVGEILDREPPGRQFALVRGGMTRHESELNALRHLSPSIRTGAVDVVAVHDGARPLSGPDLFRAVISTARQFGGAVPALPTSDVVLVSGTADLCRAALVRVQTPQAFRAQPLLDAYERATRDDYQGSDTASAVERYTDLSIRCVPGHAGNIKITYAPDLVLAEHLLRRSHMAHDPTVLPVDLPRPADDGAAAHLLGAALPDITLPATDGTSVNLARLTRPTVVYAYPRTGRPGEAPLVADWDLIPGARGCTPESCGFRDHHAELDFVGVDVYGLSTQDTAYQAEAAARLRLPFPLLSDADFRLTDALRLPTFTAAGQRLLRRLTLLVEAGVIAHLWYPVFPPDTHAAEVLQWLRARPHS